MLATAFLTKRGLKYRSWASMAVEWPIRTLARRQSTPDLAGLASRLGRCESFVKDLRLAVVRVYVPRRGVLFGAADLAQFSAWPRAAGCSVAGVPDARAGLRRLGSS